MIKLCIFDLDGTLVNSLADLAGAMNYALGTVGFPGHPVESYRKMVGNGVSILADRAAGGKEKLSPESKEKLLAEFSAYYTEHCLDNTRPYEGIPQMLDRLTEIGVRYAVNSNKPDGFSKKIVSTLFPKHNFAEVWGKREECDIKPAPDGVNGIISMLGVGHDEVLYIGDSNVDVFTAQNAGVRFCGVNWGFRSEEELRSAGASEVVSSPEDIIAIAAGERNE